jgi:hypothetical protein
VHALNCWAEPLDPPDGRDLQGDPASRRQLGLRCLRGVDTLTALGIATEIGVFSRFESAEEFMDFV